MPVGKLLYHLERIKLRRPSIKCLAVYSSPVQIAKRRARPLATRTRVNHKLQVQRLTAPLNLYPTVPTALIEQHSSTGSDLTNT